MVSEGLPFKNPGWLNNKLNLFLSLRLTSSSADLGASHFFIIIYRFGPLYFFFLKQLMCTYWCAAKSLQSSPTLCDPIDGSPPGFPVSGTLQARTLEWVAISFSNAWKWKVKVKSLSHVRLLVTPWTAAYQAPLSMGFSRQEYWSGVPLPSPIPIGIVALYLIGHYERVFKGWKSYMHINLLLLNKITQYLGLRSSGVTYMTFSLHRYENWMRFRVSAGDFSFSIIPRCPTNS